MASGAVPKCYGRIAERILMSGYAPLFDTLTKGTLCGRWPDIGLWPIVMSLADRHGIVDSSPTHISQVSGLALEEVVACMKRFCEPDPYSRTPAEDGRRLILLDPEHRDWGWRIVNHAFYREKARLMAKAAKEVESGENRTRLAENAAHRRSPPLTADERRSPPLQTPDSKEKKEETPLTPLAGGATSSQKSREPEKAPPGLDPVAWTRWLEYRKAIGKPIKPVSIPAAQRKLAGFGASQAAVVEQSIANSYQGLFELKDAPKMAARNEPARTLKDAFEVSSGRR